MFFSFIQWKIQHVESQVGLYCCQQMISMWGGKKFCPEVNSKWMLCADGSGHSVPISLEKIAVKILSEVDVRYCCHGTTKDALSSIKDQGLSRMKRQYIHFACSKKRLRVGSEVVISLNVKNYLKAGLKLYRLEDGNLAASGNRDGFIKPQYFKSISFKQ